MSLSPEERERYARNLLIPEFGTDGQERLKAARVCVAGLGGLGSPAAYYLAAAGVGTLGLLDSDRLELSNLQRQVLHGTPDLGRLKAESADERIRNLNPEIALQTIAVRLSPDNAGDILSAYDVVVEASDNFETKFLINDVCIDRRVPFATAGILSMSGQAHFVVPGQTPCLRCLVPNVPEGVPTTSELGVLGAVPGILGSLEALEVIRYLVGLWRPQPDGRGLLHAVDGGVMQLKTLRVPRRPACRCASLWST